MQKNVQYNINYNAGKTSKFVRTSGPQNAHLKPDLGAFSHNEMTLILNTHIHLLTSLVVCIYQVSGLNLR